MAMNDRSGPAKPAPKKAAARKTASKKAPAKSAGAGGRRVAAKAELRPQSMRERASERFRTFAEDTRETTKRKATQLAISVVDFQKTTMGNAIDVIGKVQDQSGKMLHEIIQKASWVPGEGREVVDEWNRTIKKGREDFRRTTDKSFDLVAQYLKRLQKQAAPATVAKSTAKKPAKQAPAKKAAPKKASRKSPSKSSGASGTRSPEGSATT